MSMDVPPPEPTSAAAIVEARAEESILEELGAEIDAGAGPIDRRADRRQVRRERWRLLLRRPGFVIGSLILIWWIVCAVMGERITPYDPLDDDSPAAPIARRRLPAGHRPPRARRAVAGDGRRS